MNTNNRGGHYRADTLASAARQAPKINHAAMDAAAIRVAGRGYSRMARLGCGCGQPRLPDKELPDSRWMARCGCGRAGYGTTLAAARAEMEGR